MNTVPVTTLHLGTTSKKSDQLRAIVDNFMAENAVIGSDKVKIHAVTSENAVDVAHYVDLHTKYVGFVRCVIRTLSIFVNKAYKASAP